MSDPRISFCIISRDNERTIRAMLESIKALAYEIIVVDTGSRDATCAIVSEYTQHLYHYVWNDSFADARNESVRYATGDWIFVLDTDEELPAGSHRPLLEKLREAEKNGVTAYACRIVSMDAGGVEGFNYMQRVFRNHIVPRPYYGRIHERLDPAFTTARADVRIVHAGHDRALKFEHKDTTYRKRLAERDLLERPDDIDACVNMIKTCMKEGAWAEALEHCALPAVMVSENKEVLILRAIIFFELHRDAEALALLQRIFSAHTVGALDLRPHLLLGQLLFRQGKHAEAYAHYVHVFVFSPEDLRRQSLSEFDNHLYNSSLFQACYLAVAQKDRMRSVRYGHWLLAAGDGRNKEEVFSLLMISAVDAGDHAAVVSLYEGYPALLHGRRAYYDTVYKAACAALGRN